MCNSRLVNHIFSTENVDAIFHLAAKTHVGEQRNLLSLVVLVDVVREPLTAPPLFFSLSFAQRRHSSALRVSSASTSTGPEFCWKPPTGPDTGHSALSTSAPMRCTGPVWTRSVSSESVGAPAPAPKRDVDPGLFVVCRFLARAAR